MTTTALPTRGNFLLDLLRELQGLIVLLRECYRSGVGLDPLATELWLYEHGYKRSPADDDDRE